MSVLSKKIFVLTVLLSLAFFVGRFCLAELSMPAPVDSLTTELNGCSELPEDNSLMGTHHHNEILPCCASGPTTIDQGIVATIIKISFPALIPDIAPSPPTHAEILTPLHSIQPDIQIQLDRLASIVIRT